MKRVFQLIIIVTCIMAVMPGCRKAEYRALIITGQSAHDWKASSPVLKTILDETGMFSTDIAVTPEKGGDMSGFSPNFSRYNLVVLDYSGDSWSENTKQAFVDYVNNGGGVVAYHGSCMAFPDWKEYNEMIGLGGWGGRDEKAGPYIYFRNNRLIVDDTSPGVTGTHGRRREFEMRTRNTEHPVMKGLPVRWMHGNDELYSKLRGPAKNMEILATANADTIPRGRGRDEPLLMAITYGKGRIFNTLIGHGDEGGGPAMQCVGFIVTFQRGAEWAVSGNVTQEVPADFPTAAGVVLRSDYLRLTLEDDFRNIGTYEIGKSTRYLTDIQERIRKAQGDPVKLLEIEKMMVGVIKNQDATVESKKLILRELSWMGSDLCIPSVEALVSNPDLKDEAEFALERLK